MMDYSNLRTNVCRICLEHNVKLNWNSEILEFCGITYKDCYYKYTHLVESDLDSSSTSLCDKCANEVKNAHMLFERALESFNILQNALDATECEPHNSYIEVCNSPLKIISETCSFDESNYIEGPLDDKIEKDDVICYSPVYDNDLAEEIRSPINYCKENSVSVNVENFKSLEIPLEQHPVDREARNGRTSNAPIETTLELKLQLEIRGTKVLKSTTKTATSKTKFSKYLHQTSKKEPSINYDLKPITRRTVKRSNAVQKYQNSTHRLFSKTPTNNAKSSKYAKEKSSQGNYQFYESSDSSILDNIICEDVTNSTVHLTSTPEELQKNYAMRKYTLDLNNCVGDTNCAIVSSELSNTLELQTLPLIKLSVEEEKASEPSDCSLLDHNIGESDSNSPPPLTIEHSKPNQLKNSTVTTRVRKKKRTYDPSDISLLQELFGKNHDMNSLLPKSTAKARDKICQYCSLKVKGTNQLKRHEATHNENRERTHICTKCGIKLYTKLSLDEHMKTHDENRQKKHKCEFCEKVFFHKGGLNVHRRIHLGLMVKCKICLKEYYRQIDLDRHLRGHSAAPLQKNLEQQKYVIQCQYCNKSVFTYKWKEHEAVHLEQPQAQCKICDKDFFSRSSCTKHLRQVHGKHCSEYEELIHYYVDRNLRNTILLMKQQLKVEPLTK